MRVAVFCAIFGYVWVCDKSIIIVGVFFTKKHTAPSAFSLPINQLGFVFLGMPVSVEKSSYYSSIESL
jgi:hypothetical protein